MCCVFAGYATLPRPVSNGPSPEELEQQRRYLQNLSKWSPPLVYFANSNKQLGRIYCEFPWMSSGLDSAKNVMYPADDPDSIARFLLGLQAGFSSRDKQCQYLFKQ